MSLDHLNEGWSLFLDRDGVINKRKVDAYVTDWTEFEFLPGVLEALYLFSTIFGKIFIVTNQQGVGKGLMSHDDLNTIHSQMLKEINNSKGRIDQIYYCPHLAHDKSYYRKPNPGMAMMAKEEFPEIEFEQSVMVGDSDSDIRFGNLLNMYTVLIEGKDEFKCEIPDARFSSLLQFAKHIL